MINTDQTLEQLIQLKLHGMAQVYSTTRALPSHEAPTAHELLAMMVEAEQHSRTGLRTQMYLKFSGLRYDAVLENIQCSPTRNLERSQLIALADCSFIQRAENILSLARQVLTARISLFTDVFPCSLEQQTCNIAV